MKTDLGSKPLVKIIAGGAFGTLTAVVMSIILLINGGDYQQALLLFVATFTPVVVSFAASYRKSEPLLAQLFEQLEAYEIAVNVPNPEEVVKSE